MLFWYLPLIRPHTISGFTLLPLTFPIGFITGAYLASPAVAVVLYVGFLEIGWVFDSVINLTDLPLALELWFSL